METPRDRLLRAGGEALADVELIAILLEADLPPEPALEAAQHLLAALGGIAGMVEVHDHLLNRKTIGEAGSAALLAAREIACRLAKAAIVDRELLDRPSAVAGYLALRYGRTDQEVMGALYLDTHCRLISEVDFYRGTLHRAAVEPRAVLKGALLRGAHGFIIFHNHPSGDPSPSAEDLEFTRRMADAAKLLGLKLIDHLIFSSANRWTSLILSNAW